MGLFATETNFIAVHIGNPSSVADPLLARVSPPSNWIGALLAGKLLNSALQRAGVLVSLDAGCFGELTDCSLVAEVTDVAAAVAAIRAELDDTPLESFYHIGVREDGHWQSVHPTPGKRLDWLLDTDRQAAALENLKAAGRDWCAQLEALCSHWHQILATAPEADKARLSPLLARLAAATLQTRESVAPQIPGEEGNAS